jgi:hypothetical protein
MELSSYWPETHQPTRLEAESSSQKERRLREGADNGADSVAGGQPLADRAFNLAALRSAYPIKRQNERTENPGIPRRRNPKEPPPLTD